MRTHLGFFVKALPQVFAPSTTTLDLFVWDCTSPTITALFITQDLRCRAFNDPLFSIGFPWEFLFGWGSLVMLVEVALVCLCFPYISHYLDPSESILILGGSFRSRRTPQYWIGDHCRHVQYIWLDLRSWRLRNWYSWSLPWGVMIGAGLSPFDSKRKNQS